MRAFSFQSFVSIPGPSSSLLLTILFSSLEFCSICSGASASSPVVARSSSQSYLSESYYPILDRLAALKGSSRALLTHTVDGEEVKFVRPFVTLSYATSLDGSIADAYSQSLPLSGRESMRMTHALRASHDSILVGVNTVINDNPSLTVSDMNCITDQKNHSFDSERVLSSSQVRHVEGDNPKPVVLDSKLASPVTSKLLTSDACERPLIATTMNIKDLKPGEASGRCANIQRLGGQIMQCEKNANGRVDIRSLMYQLSIRKIQSLMVEGGASVIRSFLSSGLVDLCIITVAPTLIGGFKAIPSDPQARFPDTVDVEYAKLENDLIVHFQLNNTKFGAD